MTNLNHEFSHCPCPHLPLYMLSTVTDFTDTLLRCIMMVTSKWNFKNLPFTSDAQTQ